MATVKQIEKRLAAKIGELHVDRDEKPTRSSTSVRYISTLIDIWSLRFQLAQLKLLTAEDDQRFRLVNEASDASRHLAEHEKRLRVARKSKIDDDEDDAGDHEAAQEGHANTLRLLAGK